MLLTRIFYTLKPFIPRRLQLFLRRQIAAYKRKKYAHAWPIDPNAGDPPEGWHRWPEGKNFALVLTHDVDKQKGHDNVLKLAQIEEELGFRSSFNFIPERYKVSHSLRIELEKRGFEVGVHGLNHDGNLYKSREIFDERAFKINKYLKEWNAVGFRSPAMHHNLDWIHELNIEYDASTFDTDPFEPQSDGVGTIFPFWVEGASNQPGYVELPYTLPQDFTPFIIMKEKTNKIWKEKLAWIVEKGGMALFNTHPDYINFDGRKSKIEEYLVEYYAEFLEYIKHKYEGQYWHVLPKEISSFFKSFKFDANNSKQAKLNYLIHDISRENEILSKRKSGPMDDGY